MKHPGCPLCDAAGGAVVYEAAKFRVIRADEPGFPAFWRVVWTDHVAEFSDLARDDRILCMDAVAAVELAVREAIQPTKVNVAALGNMVPHLHWHVIARFDWDSRFPAPVWSPATREVAGERWASVDALLPATDEAIGRRLGALAAGRTPA